MNVTAWVSSKINRLAHNRLPTKTEAVDTATDEARQRLMAEIEAVRRQRERLARRVCQYAIACGLKEALEQAQRDAALTPGKTNRICCGDVHRF